MQNKSDWKKISLWLISFFVVFFMVKEFKSIWFESNSEQKISESTTQLIQSEIDKAKNQTKDGNTIIGAMQENAQRDIDEKIANETDVKKKIVTAASTLYGAYLLNVRARPLYCDKFGVKMDAFVREYKKVNDSVYRAIYQIESKHFALSKTPFDEDKLFEIIKDSNLKIAAVDTQDMATQFKATEKDICFALNANAIEVAKEMDLKVTQPKLTQIVLIGVVNFQ
jgi:hypothetical protein